MSMISPSATEAEKASGAENRVICAAAPLIKSSSESRWRPSATAEPYRVRVRPLRSGSGGGQQESAQLAMLPDDQRMERLFHIARMSDREQARRDGAYRVSTLGKPLDDEVF